MAERGKRKTRIGLVVSNKMDKTAVVSVENRIRHKLYGRFVKSTKKVKAHDAENQCQVGDKVKIMETRPLSKEKRWRVIKVIEKSQFKQ